METDKKIIIELKKIRKSFGDREVLKGIDMSVYEGDMVAVMGKSGAGKTTLLNILGFFEAATEGDYFFDGRKVERSQTSRLRNMNIGFVFQSYNLIPKMTVYENIILPICYSMRSTKEKDKYIRRVPELLQKYHIENIRNEYIDHISGGEKQRVCLARALSCDARLLIADEPTGNLDKDNTNDILADLTSLNAAGKTIIIVTHDEKVRDIASRKMLLKEGKMIENAI